MECRGSDTALECGGRNAALDSHGVLWPLVDAQTMTEHDYIEVISGQRRGALASLQRAGLRSLSSLYRGIIAVRNAYYDTWAMPTWLPVPVISVGNLTVGGTGKTPMTIWLCQRLLERGRKPAVLTRGYKAENGWADELLLVSRRVPKAVAIAHKDRRRAGELAVQEYGVRAAVLDDGFQHRRLGRDLDIVLIDATRPFGFDQILPRGLLREPLQNLRRAEAVVITRSDQVEEASLEKTDSVVHGLLREEVPIAHAVHRPAGWADLQGRACETPKGRIGAFAGIARPEAFLQTLAAMGIRPESVYWWPDHHAYRREHVKDMLTRAQQARLDALVTTEKDAVKLARLEAEWRLPLAALQIEIELTTGADRILGALDRMLLEHEESNEPHGRHPESQ